MDPSSLTIWTIISLESDDVNPYMNSRPCGMVTFITGYVVLDPSDVMSTGEADSVVLVVVILPPMILIFAGVFDEYPLFIVNVAEPAPDPL